MADEGKGTDAEALDNEKRSKLKLSAGDREDIEKFKIKDRALEDGPLTKRSCTDCLFAIFFLVAIAAMFAAAIYGWSSGKPDQLLIGWDSDQRGCGYSKGTEDYNFLYWP